jgi:uncharacterized protein involved in exopolysaccharide biosynthesis
MTMNPGPDNKSSYIQDDEIDLYQLWMTLWNSRKFIITFSASITILTMLISLFMENIYRAESTIMPVAASRGIPADIAGMAAMAGISVGGSADNSQKVMVVANSRTVKSLVINEFEIVKLIKDEIPSKRDPHQYALEKLDELVNVREDKKTGLITISFDWADAAFAADVVNRYVQIVQETLEVKALDINKMQRVFLEKRLAQEKEKFHQLKNEMARFQSRTKIIEPQEQSKGTMNIYSALVGQKIALEVQLQGYESALTPDNPRLMALKQQINALKKRIASIESGSSEGAMLSMKDAPANMVAYTDILEKVKISQGVYETLAKLYEKSKLDEAKNEVYVEVIDNAIVPDLKHKPKRALITIVAAFTSGFLAVFIVFFMEYIKNYQPLKD